ncbi:methylmalonyl-CoA mutase family protein [Mangrovimonas futianensis]|uniref:methylmalonyl-CoA mutase family protein n=1 Tax=Mangrovimonas futianensis TaxID=2895523 RepID=UPI001E34040C|nr:methylmalonyl-CoA mutase family protein [Mangrovimonas futianensis]MCF1421835.1 methylmalonyl-CoA mutase subunit beta [Mangrovimonas futianensis]
MSTQNKSLFSNFSPTSKQEWKDKVDTDLKGVDFNKLIWKNFNGLNFQPFYNSEDGIESLPNTGLNSQDLVNFRSIKVSTSEEGNQLAKLAINEGVNGLLFEIDGKIQVEALLNGVDLNKVAISFLLQFDQIDFAKSFLIYAVSTLKQKENLKGYFDFRGISNYVTNGSLNKAFFDNSLELLKLTGAFPNFKAFTITGASYLDSGSNQVQEVAYSLNSLVFVVEKLMEKGVDANQIFQGLHVELAIGSEYFIEIAKFRAFQSLLNLLANEYGVTDFNPFITAKTSVWSKSVTDAHTNLLRATTEAMSAILGNVDGVLIDPYDKEFNEASQFSNRIAGNIATILKEESYLGKVANPVDGSYYIEEATQKIAEKALILFKEVEAQGGFFEAFEKGLIQDQISEIRQEKIKWISQRRLPLVGVNKYPNLMETVSSEVLSSGASSDQKLLKPRRASLEIEVVRKATELLVESIGKRPVIELCSFGNLTMRKARAAFSYDFLGVSGFKVLDEKSYETAQLAAEASAESDSEVVVICSSDPDYQESALNFVETFRSKNSEKVLLLAGNPVDLLDQLKEAGLDGCLHIKSDVIQTLTAIQNKVQEHYKSLEV